MSVLTTGSKALVPLIRKIARGLPEWRSRIGYDRALRSRPTRSAKGGATQEYEDAIYEDVVDEMSQLGTSSDSIARIPIRRVGRDGPNVENITPEIWDTAKDLEREYLEQAKEIFDKGTRGRSWQEVEEEVLREIMSERVGLEQRYLRRLNRLFSNTPTGQKNKVLKDMELDYDSADGVVGHINYKFKPTEPWKTPSELAKEREEVAAALRSSNYRKAAKAAGIGSVVGGGTYGLLSSLLSEDEEGVGETVVPLDEGSSRSRVSRRGPGGTGLSRRNYEMDQYPIEMQVGSHPSGGGDNEMTEEDVANAPSWLRNALAGLGAFTGYKRGGLAGGLMGGAGGYGLGELLQRNPGAYDWIKKNPEMAAMGGMLGMNALGLDKGWGGGSSDIPEYEGYTPLTYENLGGYAPSTEVPQMQEGGVSGGSFRDRMNAAMGEMGQMEALQDSTRSNSRNFGLIEQLRKSAVGESLTGPELTDEIKGALLANRMQLADRVKGMSNPGSRRNLRSIFDKQAALNIHPLAPFWNRAMNEQEGVGAFGKIPKWEGGPTVAPADTAGTWGRALEEQGRENAFLKSLTAPIDSSSVPQMAHGGISGGEGGLGGLRTGLRDAIVNSIDDPNRQGVNSFVPSMLKAYDEIPKLQAGGITKDQYKHGGVGQTPGGTQQFQMTPPANQYNDPNYDKTHTNRNVQYLNDPNLGSTGNMMQNTSSSGVPGVPGQFQGTAMTGGGAGSGATGAIPGQGTQTTGGGGGGGGGGVPGIGTGYDPMTAAIGQNVLEQRAAMGGLGSNMTDISLARGMAPHMAGLQNQWFNQQMGMQGFNQRERENRARFGMQRAALENQAGTNPYMSSLWGSYA